MSVGQSLSGVIKEMAQEIHDSAHNRVDWYDLGPTVRSSYIEQAIVVAEGILSEIRDDCKRMRLSVPHKNEWNAEYDSVRINHPLPIGRPQRVRKSRTQKAPRIIAQHITKSGYGITRRSDR